jgi:hypothetical protein
VIVSWQQTALAREIEHQLAAQPPSAPFRADSPGPQIYTLDAARLAARRTAPTPASERQTAVGEQVLRVFKLDRSSPTVRLVRFRRGKRSACLVVRLPEAATVRVIAGARVVVARRLRSAGLNGFRFRLPAGVPPRLRLELVDRAGNAGRAAPFVSRPRRS